MAESSNKDFASEFSTKAITKAWSDTAYKSRLLQNPRAALAEVGITAPPELELKVVENSNRLVYLVLPPPPSGELSEESLALVAGGWIPRVTNI
jgi:hypothetical protein